MTGSGDPRVEVLVLGPVGVVVGEESLEIGRRMERMLVVRLALARGRVVPDEALARDLWGEEELEPDRVVERLRVLSHRLRRALGAYSFAVRRSGGGYTLDAVVADADAASEALGRTTDFRRTGDPKRALGVIVEALELWRGPALADLRDVPFAATEAARLDGIQRELQVQRVELELELGIDNTTDVERLVIEHPLDERLTGLATIALYRAGRQADALDRLSRLRTRLADELGVDPSPATVELEVRILRQDPELLPAAEAARSRLPELPWLTPRENFVGRSKDLVQLVDELDRLGLVTIVGGPGAGKTLLAREAAIALQRGGRPVAWCDLASVTDSPGLVTALAVATGVDAGPDAFGGAVERLEGALLVLDNAEHLVDEVAELARTIVWKGNRLSVLVTSQRPLRLRNEHIHRLGSLDPSAAAELFKARSKWDAGELDDDRVTAICAAVDRLPLGIELAAGLLRTLTLDQLAVRIDRRMRLLVAGNRDSGARHSSLRAAIDWSYALLDSAGQSVLERLSVFVGGCTLEAAEEVAGGNGIPVADIPVILADLHERSLLTVTTVNGVPRYVLLESIRDFALERLAGEDDAVRREHARWCADLAGRTERYGAADHSDLVRELRAEEANLRAAIAFCLDNDPPGVLRIVSPTWWFWWSHGMIAQGRDWLRRALAAADPAPTLERATALRVTASLTRNSGDFEPARELGEEALAMFRDLGDQRGVGSSLVGVAITSLAVRDFGQALDQATEAAGVFRPMGNERLLCTALNVVGAALRGLGRTQEAEEVLRDVCARWTAIDDPRGLAGSLVSVALIRLHIGDLVETRELLVRAMRLYRQLELTEGVIDALDLLAAVEVVEGRPALALRMLTVAGLERTRIGAPQIMMDELDARDAAERSARAALGITAAGVVAEARAVPFEAIVAEFS